MDSSLPFQKALVTGGAGFIGSHIVQALLDTGIEVVSVDDYSTGKTQNLSALVNRKLLTVVRCDIKTLDVDNSKLKKVGMVTWTGLDEGLRKTVAWHLMNPRQRN